MIKGREGEGGWGPTVGEGGWGHTAQDKTLGCWTEQTQPRSGLRTWQIDNKQVSIISQWANGSLELFCSL